MKSRWNTAIYCPVVRIIRYKPYLLLSNSPYVQDRLCSDYSEHFWPTFLDPQIINKEIHLPSLLRSPYLPQKSLIHR
jgi:hypothetical protein